MNTNDRCAKTKTTPKQNTNLNKHKPGCEHLNLRGRLSSFDNAFFGPCIILYHYFSGHDYKSLIGTVATERALFIYFLLVSCTISLGKT